jgi:NAD(P)H dehydrogenase (quinone)
VRILVVFAHPKRDSFTGRILDSFVAGLEQAGHVAEVADLYGEGFQPLLVPEDYAQWEDRPMPADVIREQARVERSEGIALVFPVWWWSMPAILKGWFDRVFSAGWAYSEDYDPEGSLLPGRKFVLLCPAGSSEATTRSTATTRCSFASSKSGRSAIAASRNVRFMSSSRCTGTRS